MEKTQDEVRIAARDRKRAQRERDSVAKEESRLRTMDPGEKRVLEIMARISAEPRKPRVVIEHGPCEPAKLPSLVAWSQYLKSISRSEAIAKELARLEVAIQSGMVAIAEERQVNNATL